MQKNQKGFTLIELLVVIAIIGALAAIGLTNFSSARKKSRDTKRVADMDYASKALEQYFMDNNTYVPAATFEVAINTTLKDAGYTERDIKAVSSAAYPYKYCVSSDGLYYKVTAKFENANNPALTEDEGSDDTLYEVGNATGSNSGKVTAGDCS